MVKRREFPSRIKVAAFERARGRCENCTRRLYPGDTQYDHEIPDNSGGEPTLENCRVLCRSCHGSKTKHDVTKITKNRRVRAKHLGIKKKRGFRGWRKFDGTVVYADER